MHLKVAANLEAPERLSESHFISTTAIEPAVTTNHITYHTSSIKKTVTNIYGHGNNFPPSQCTGSPVAIQVDASPRSNGMLHGALPAVGSWWAEEEQPKSYSTFFTNFCNTAFYAKYKNYPKKLVPIDNLHFCIVSKSRNLDCIGKEEGI